MNDYTEVRIDMSPCNETMTDVMAACVNMVMRALYPTSAE